MFVIDIESAGIESTCGILSIGAIHVPDEEVKTRRQWSFKELVSSGFFVKFDLRDQVKNYGRTTDQSTLDWWKKQGEIPKRMSLLPSENDKTLPDGLNLYQEWVSCHPGFENEYFWIRGSLDQMAIDSSLRVCGIKPVVPYNQWRDIRTYIDLVYPNSKNGYVGVDKELCMDYNADSVVKHDPVQDVCQDFCMMLCGIIS